MADRLALMVESELVATMSKAADEASAALPRGTLFVLIAFDPIDVVSGADRGIGQYIANCERGSVVAVLREVADRIEQAGASERARSEAPAYRCPRCGAIGHHRGDPRFRYCRSCGSFGAG